MCKSSYHYVHRVLAITPQPNEPISELERHIYTVFCGIALYQLPGIIHPCSFIISP